MAFDAYLKIDGIPGESTDDKHADWIEVVGYEYGATQATSATASSAGGASSERVNLSDFSIRKVVDKASAKGHVTAMATLVNRAGGDKVTYLTITMEEVVVSSVKFLGNMDAGNDAADVSDLPKEEVKFNYARIKTEYVQQKRGDGQGGGKVVGGWDRTKNKTHA